MALRDVNRELERAVGLLPKVNDLLATSAGLTAKIASGAAAGGILAGGIVTPSGQPAGTVSSGGGGGGGSRSGGGEKIQSAPIRPSFGSLGPPRTPEQLDALCQRRTITVQDPLDPLNPTTVEGWQCPEGFYADPTANEPDRVSGRSSGGARAGGGGRDPGFQIQGTRESGAGVQAVLDPDRTNRGIGRGRAAAAVTSAVVTELQSLNRNVEGLRRDFRGDGGAGARADGLI